MNGPASRGAPLGSTRGATLLELIVAMTVLAVVLPTIVSLFLLFQRSVDRQVAVRDVQAEAHLSAERLVRMVRNAEQIGEESSGDRLVVVGGMAGAVCGENTCWVELAEENLVARTPDGELESATVLARFVTALVFEFGLDDDGSGSVDTFSAAVPVGRAGDVLSVRMVLSFDAGGGPAAFSGELDMVASVRARIFPRLSLSG